VVRKWRWTTPSGKALEERSLRRPFRRQGELERWRGWMGGDAFADEDGDEVDAELVDFALVQKGGDDFAAAHHPNVSAGLGAEALGEWFEWLVDEFEGRQRRLARVAGKKT